MMIYDLWIKLKRIKHEITRQIRFFFQRKKRGFSMDLNEQKWSEIIDKMVKGFESYIFINDLLYLKIDGFDFDKIDEIMKQKENEVKEGFDLFIKYFGDLWS